MAEQKEQKKKNPFDEIIEELESYDKGCDPLSLLDSGE